MLQVCTSKFKFNFVSTFQSASKSTPRDCEAEWRGAACMACVYSMLLTSTNRYRILRTPQPKKRFFYISSRSVNCYGLRPSSTDFSFVSSKALSSFYQLSHFASTEHALAKDGAHFCLCISFRFSTARFANISLQTSPTFRRCQRGHNMEVWASIDVVLLLGRAQMSTEKNIHQEIIFVSYFWLPDMAGLWILLSFPDLQKHLKVAWVEYIANRLCRLKKLLGFSVTNKFNLHICGNGHIFVCIQANGV